MDNSAKKTMPSRQSRMGFLQIVLGVTLLLILPPLAIWRDITSQTHFPLEQLPGFHWFVGVFASALLLVAARWFSGLVVQPKELDDAC